MNGLFIRGGGTAGQIPITNPVIIATIIDTANWDDTGYTGSIAGLVTGNVYYDDINAIEYFFDGTTLRRQSFNNVD